MTKTAGRVKILQIGKFYSPYAGGMETHLEDLCVQLNRSADVRVIVANTSAGTVSEEISGIRVHRAGTWGSIANAPISPGLVNAIRRSPADIVHIHWPNPAAVLAYIASRHPGQLVVTYHSDIVGKRLAALLFHPILNRVIARSAAVIATSPNYVESSPILSRFKNLCHVIPYGIATERMAAPNPAVINDIKARYGPRTVLAVGRLVYYKGFEYLVRAMRHVDGRALIIGDGPLRENLKAIAVSCGVTDRVVFLGEKSGQDLVPYFHAAEVFALPSVARSEAFGIVQLEAMACGKPVINTNLDSGVPFASLDGKTGLTVPPADPESLAAAINLLLNETELRSRFGEAGRRRVFEEFRLETMTERTCDLYRQILESRPLLNEANPPLFQGVYAAPSNTRDEASL